jgi:nicotinamide riboside kinase
MNTIAITGPECAGKSQLTADLQATLGGWTVSEYARTYLQNLPRTYRVTDLLAIAAGQEKSYYSNQSQFPNASWAFLDTWDYVLEIWSEVRFDLVHPQLLDFRNRIAVDHYLLCAPDLPWEADPLREHPESRKDLFSRYQSALDRDGVSYSVVEGMGSSRNQSALNALQSLISKAH